MLPFPTSPTWALELEEEDSESEFSECGPRGTTQSKLFHNNTKILCLFCSSLMNVHRNYLEAIECKRNEGLAVFY